MTPTTRTIGENILSELNRLGWKQKDLAERLGTEAASELGIDLHDIATGAGHTDPRMTRRMYVPVLNSRLQQMSEALNGRFQGWPSGDSVVPNLDPASKQQTPKDIKSRR